MKSVPYKSIINLFFAILWLSSCQSPTASKEPKETFLVPESQFKYFNIASIKYEDIEKDIDTDNPRVGIFNLFELSKEQKNNWTNQLDELKPLFEENRAFKYDAHAYSLQEKSGDNNVMIFHVHTEGFAAFVMLVISDSGKVVDKIVLAGAACQGPYQDEKTGRIKWCDKVSSILPDKNSIIKSEVFETSDGYERTPGSIKSDSIVSTYRIIESGRIKLLSTNSYKVTK